MRIQDFGAALPVAQDAGRGSGEFDGARPILDDLSVAIDRAAIGITRGGVVAEGQDRARLDGHVCDAPGAALRKTISGGDLERPVGDVRAARPAVCSRQCQRTGAVFHKSAVAGDRTLDVARLGALLKLRIAAQRVRQAHEPVAFAADRVVTEI